LGRCPEDGQTVFFEATEELALEFFVQQSPDVWTFRLARVCADLFAVYTADRSDALVQVAREASLVFGVAYYELVCDENLIGAWRNGELWMEHPPSGRLSKANQRKLKETLFTKSQAEIGETFWNIVSEFSWGHAMEHDYLLDRDEK